MYSIRVITAIVLLLALLIRVLAWVWPRRHPELLAQRRSEMTVPHGFEADTDEIERLEIEKQRDPQVIGCLIQVHERILERLRFGDYPVFRASIQNNLGAAYAILPTGDRGANLMKAIDCHQQALLCWTPETAPFEYAGTQTNLGEAYRNLLTGDRGANLVQAIACYQQALRFWTPEAAPFEYAMVQNNLGIVYWESPTEDRGANLVQAIACFEQALRFWTPKTAPFEYATTQTNLGLVYSDLPTEDRGANLVQAIACFEQALRFWTPEAAPSEYATTQNNLGIAYRNLPIGDLGENLAQAIACYQQALHIWTPETAPLKYATTQNNLGNAYANLPIGNRGENLAKAITCFQQALRFQTPETAPSDYAMTLTNLGITYRSLPMGDQAANLAQAIACYQQALRYRTPESAPYEYATIQNNLGVAYASLPTGDRGANLAQAIDCYHEALRFWTAGAAPFNYAAAQNNLGIAYTDLPTGDRGANLEQAIACYQQALRFWAPEAAPFNYATIQNNLGTAYADLPTGDRGFNLAQAMTCYHQALRFWKSEEAPFNYAWTKHNLGTAYADLPTGDQEANLARAVACYQEALNFWSPDTSPSECRKTGRDLANIFFNQQRWDLALAAYKTAIDAGERRYRAGLSTESKATEIAENTHLYQYAAFAAARYGNSTEAFLILERGKTRLLTEALRLRVPRPTGILDDVWDAFERVGAAVRAAQIKDIAMPNEVRDPVQAYDTHIQIAKAASADLDAAIEQVRVHAPNFLRAIDLPAIQNLLPDEHIALVAFCITDQGSMGFVLSHASGEPVQMIEVPDFTQTNLANLLIERDTDGKPNGGWLWDYWSRNQNRWQRTMDHVLAQVGKQLIAPVVATLPAGIQKLILLPSGSLFLLPLHAVPLSDGDSTRLCDRYQISYAPSAEVLADSRAKAMRAGGQALYAVINPEADRRPLAFAPTEGAAIVSLFTAQQVHEGRAGTKEAVVAGLHGKTYLHFACHGGYEWRDPPESGLDLTDGHLTLAELQRGTVDLSTARLVTLSACETGITDIFQGSAEEYVGLPAGFMLAGVPCVVSSLWAVPDISTALLMERFYRNHLKGGMDFPAALQEAQAWVCQLKAQEVSEYAETCYQQSRTAHKAELLKYILHYRYQAETDPIQKPFAHPHYWAAFTVNGM